MELHHRCIKLNWKFADFTQNLHKKYRREDFMLSVNPLSNKHGCAVFFWGQHPSLRGCGCWSWQQMLSCIYRRARRCPRGRREKLMLARRETTLQKMEMPKQTRYPSSLLCTRIDSFPSQTGTGLGLWQGQVLLTTLNADEVLVKS